MGTYAVLMHSWGLAIANSVLGLFFFIPVFFVSIGCLNYLLEILRVGSSWILDRLRRFNRCLLHFWVVTFLNIPICFSLTMDCLDRLEEEEMGKEESGV